MKILISLICFILSGVSSVNGDTVGEEALKLINEEIERRAQAEGSVEIEDLRYIEVESIDGRKLQAKVIEHDGETLKFYSMAAKQEYEVSFDRLSEKTQKLLREKVPTRFLELRQGWADKSHHGEEKNAVADVLLGLGISSVYEQITDPVEREKHRDYTRKKGLSPMHGLASFSGVPHFEGFPTEALRGDRLGSKTSLYGSIEYLMPLKDAEQALKGIVDHPSSQTIICPGFPDRAFKLYLYPVSREYREQHGFDDGTQISGYNSIGLAVDGRRQVVAVQLNRTTAVDDLTAVNGTSGGGRRLFNFLEYKKSATPNGGVGIYMSEGVYWRCRFYQSRALLGFNILKVTQQERSKPVLLITKGFRSERRNENYSMLMMHANVARILLYNIEKNWLVHDEAFKRVKELDTDELIEIRDELKALPTKGNDQPF